MSPSICGVASSASTKVVPEAREAQSAVGRSAGPAKPGRDGTPSSACSAGPPPSLQQPSNPAPAVPTDQKPLITMPAPEQASPPPFPAVPPLAVSLCRPLSIVDTTATTAAASAAVTPTASSTTNCCSNDAAASAAASTVDWSRVRLGVDAAPTMFVARWSADTGCRWDGGELVPYGPLSLLPAAQVLNYGQSIFEGMKAYRCDHDNGIDGAEQEQGQDGGGGAAASRRPRVLLFRADANAARFEAGAERMCMPPVPPAMFLAAVAAVVRANADWVPPASRGSLYLRPLLLGTGPLLGLCPAPSYTFLVYAVPVGGRAKGGRLTALDYLVHDSLHRAAPRGVGSTKAAGNYSPCLKAQAEARAAGCHECIYLDARSDTYLEEGSGCNVFAAHGSVLTTPPAAGSILPGITRLSLLQLAAALGYDVREAPLTVPDAMQADEMFASGTAVVVQPIGSITFRGRRVQFCRGGGGEANGAAGVAADGATSTTSGGNSREELEAIAATSDRQDDHGAAGVDKSSSNTNSSSSSCVCEPEEPEEDPVAVAAFGGGRRVTELTAEERAALAAAAPVPEPGSLPPGVGPVAQRLYGLLTAIQYGRAPDPFGWTQAVDMEGPAEGPLRLDRLLAPSEGDDEAAVDTKGAASGGSKAESGAAAAAAKARPLGLPRTVFADPNLE